MKVEKRPLYLVGCTAFSQATGSRYCSKRIGGEAPVHVSRRLILVFRFRSNLRTAFGASGAGYESRQLLFVEYERFPARIISSVGACSCTHTNTSPL